MGRNIAAGIAGVVVAGLLVMLVESIGHMVYPPPPDLDFSDAAAMRVYIASLPLGAFLFVAGAWFTATLGGVITACKIGHAKPMTYAMIVGGLMLAATAYNLATIPHPLWFSITGIAAIVVAASLGLAIGTSTQPSAAE